MFNLTQYEETVPNFDGSSTVFSLKMMKVHSSAKYTNNTLIILTVCNYNKFYYSENQL